jgi:FixJ family two-component response regulator
LITDVVMPGMSGAELSRRLLSRNPELRVVYMSGYTDDNIAHHGVLERGVLLVEKPFGAVELTHKVRQALDQRSAPALHEHAVADPDEERRGRKKLCR